MIWFEILEQGKPVKRFKRILSDLKTSLNLMDTPMCSITLPIDYLEYLSARKQVRIHMDDRTFLGYVDGIDTDPVKGTLDVTIAHIVREWKFRQVPTNYAKKDVKLPEVFDDAKMRYSDAWTIEYDDTAKETEVDYVYSRQDKLEALTTSCENTQSLYWRVSLSEDRKIEVGEFGRKTPFILSTRPANGRNIQIIEEPQITEDYSNVMNMATVYGTKSDSGMSSLSLREVYENKELQNEKFPVVIISSEINNERDYDYTQYNELAPNNELEYSVIDTESVAMESGLFIEGTIAFDDISPFATEDESSSSTSTKTSNIKWVIPEDQRYISEEDTATNLKCFAGKMLSLGASLQAICGMWGNIARECGGNPNLWQNLSYNPSLGFGLVQWTPGTQCTNWLQSRGYTDFRTYGNAQCELIHEEMETGQQWYDKGYGMSFAEFWVSEADPGYLSTVFYADYERGPDMSDASNRYAIAQQAYETLEPIKDTLGVPKNAGQYDDESATVATVATESATVQTYATQSSDAAPTGSWNPAAWMEEHLNISLDPDKVYGFQCVDTFKQLLIDLGDTNGARPIGGDGYAEQIWYRREELGYSTYFDFIPAADGAQFGDFAVFAKGGDTPYSHIAIFREWAGDGVAYFFGQNQPYPYHNYALLHTSNILGYLRVKDYFWDTNAVDAEGNPIFSGTIEGNGQSDIVDKTNPYTSASGGNGSNTITEADRIKAATVAYEAAIKRLINARRTYEISVKTTKLPADLNVGDQIQLLYDNRIFRLESCGNYMRKLLTANNWFYIVGMDIEIAPDGTETGVLALEKYLRTEREVQKE